jgi:tRNA threonylcarbamoyladenosine biosynthesis protein TsaB
MKLLAFDTSTETLSIAVSRTTPSGMQTWEYSGAGGAKASTDLIAKVMDLLRQAEVPMHALDAICFGAGPGSFTGLRTACSVAQGLAFGANVPVLPIDTLMAVAETARMQMVQQVATPHRANAPLEMTALLDARMDEMYAARYAFDGTQWTTLESSHLVRPDAFALPELSETAGVPHVVAGNVFAVYGDRLLAALGNSTQIVCLPTAAAILHIAPALLARGLAVTAAEALPLYIRDKVAKTTAERMAEKAAEKAVAKAAV